MPVVGRTNELSFETDDPDLAAFERVQDEFYGDAEAMELWRRRPLVRLRRSRRAPSPFFDN